jgi:TnpA family transposase
MITSTQFVEKWFLLPHEQPLLANRTAHSRIGMALFLKFFQEKGHFPSKREDIPKEAVEYMAVQIEVPPNAWYDLAWEGPTAKRLRAEIRQWFGFREATVADAETLETWLVEEVLNQEHRPDRLKDAVIGQCRKLCIEPPAVEQVRRLVGSANQRHEIRFCEGISGKLNSLAVEQLDKLLEADPSEEDEGGWTKWQTLKDEPGRAGLASVKDAASRLRLLRKIGLPAELFQGVPPKLIERYAKRAAVEEPFELRRHTGPLKATLMAAFLHRRTETLTDHLVDLLVETVHKMGKGAEKKIDSSLERALQKKAAGKISKLYQIAKASVDEPKGAVEDVIFPVAPEPWLRTLINEIENSSDYKGKVRRALHRSYRSHYRPMLPEILNNLEFRCTNTRYQPIIEALNILKENLHHRSSTYPKGVKPLLKGVVPSDWMSFVVDGDGKKRKINRTAYEICVLKALREQLRCREIWVIGSRRYRNPEEDLPQDFEERKAAYYEDIGIPLDAKAFIAALREELTRYLKALNKGMPTNSKIKIVRKKGEYRISLTPLDPKPDPENLAILKQEMNRRWWGTSLLDMLKETDLRASFTQCLRSGTERSRMDETTLQRRLLLCLFGLGTNTGIKSMESRPADDYKDLLYVRRRFVSAEGLRQAIAKVVNATFAARLPRIWGEATTACASDSKQFRAWDQNLLTEYHLRYGGRGVMVYWHVEKNATCIYSQLKRVSSSEAAYMIDGVLRHCTDMEVNRQYVDSHGQTTVAFAFCRLLGFELMPRLKDISRQKLYKVEAGQVFENLEQVMAPKAINWDLIEVWLDAMVKHAVALKLGMADAESILRRFTRNNTQHPIYKALFELGKVIKTIFLCRYLSSEEIRREVHEGLNVVESWNSTNGFIFYGKAGELATNRRENQEISLLCLHLLQASLVYINTLMIQEILGDPEWLKRMTIRDLAALSPLLTLHINPYGRFDLDMDARIPIKEAA